MASRANPMARKNFVFFKRVEFFVYFGLAIGLEEIRSVLEVDVEQVNVKSIRSVVAREDQVLNSLVVDDSDFRSSVSNLLNLTLPQW